MESTKQDKPVCGICGTPIILLGIENKIILSQEEKDKPFHSLGSELYINDFKSDCHLKCRIKCAKYSSAGLRPRWLLRNEYIVNNNNRTAYTIVENLKSMNYEQLRRHGLYLYGQPGTGKTHLLSSLCSHFIDRTVNSFNITWANTSSILTNIRSSFGKKYEYGEETVQEIVTTQMKNRYVFLDDLGTESATEWAKEMLYEIINYRYEEQLATFISSNLSPQELFLKVGDKFTSRIIEMCRSVKIEGDDFRLQKADERQRDIQNKNIIIPVFCQQMANWDTYPEYKKMCGIV